MEIAGSLLVPINRVNGIGFGRDRSFENKHDQITGTIPVNILDITGERLGLKQIGCREYAAAQVPDLGCQGFDVSRGSDGELAGVLLDGTNQGNGTIKRIIDQRAGSPGLQSDIKARNEEGIRRSSDRCKNLLNHLLELGSINRVCVFHNYAAVYGACKLGIRRVRRSNIADQHVRYVSTGWNLGEVQLNRIRRAANTKSRGCDDVICSNAHKILIPQCVDQTGGACRIGGIGHV